MVKSIVHSCNKEAEIAEIRTKVNEIHHILVGNGQPGLVAEFNQAKGIINFLKYTVGLLGISGIVLVIKAFI